MPISASKSAKKTTRNPPSPHPPTVTTVYHLQLEHGCHYVGKTKRPVGMRFAEHVQGKGPLWTQKHAPLRVVSVKPGDGHDETAMTHRLMERHGMDKVRGGPYCRIRLSVEDEAEILKLIAVAGDHCYRCGKVGHFGRDCPNQTDLLQQFSNFKIESDQDWDNVSEDACYAQTTVSGTPIRRVCQRPSPSQVTIRDTCRRCNRSGHDESGCFAKTAVSGAPIVIDPSPRQDRSNKCTRCGRSSHSTDKCYAKTTTSGTPLMMTQPPRRQGPSNSACTRCGRSGHSMDKCYAKTNSEGLPITMKQPPPTRRRQDRAMGCTRCGRGGHSAETCYAKTTTDGQSLAAGFVCRQSEE